MKKTDVPSKKQLLKRTLSLVTVSLFLMVCVYVYHYYDTYESIMVQVKESAAVEYGSANYDINNLIEKVEGEIVSVKQDVDTKVVGEQEVIVEVKKAEVVKEIPIKVSVVDTTPPAINLKEEKITITKGQGYDLTNNVESVQDVVDGVIDYLQEVKEDSNFYYSINLEGDINSVGEHKVVVNAKDKYGNVSETSYVLVVTEPKVERKVENSNNAGTTQATTYANVAPNAAGGDLSSIAYSLVGRPYVSGSNGPYGFDCSGFVQYVYAQKGISVSRSSYTQANEGVGVSYADAQPGDILSWGHGGRVTHSAIYVGNGMMVHATNPRQGVVASNVADWDRGSYDSLMAVRRIQ